MADVDATPRIKKHNGCAGAKRGTYRLKVPANQGLLQTQSCVVQIHTHTFSGAWFSARRNSTLLGLKFRSIRNAVLLIQPGIAVLRHTASFSALPIYGKSYSQDTTACSLAYKLCGRTVRFNKCGKTFYAL